MQEKRHDCVVEMWLCFFSRKAGDYKMLFVATRKCRSTRYREKQREFQVAYLKNTDVMFGEYLKYWFEHIYSLRIETTTRMLGSYTLYELILPSMETDVKLRFVTVEYLDKLLEKV